MSKNKILILSLLLFSLISGVSFASNSDVPVNEVQNLVDQSSRIQNAYQNGSMTYDTWKKMYYKLYRDCDRFMSLYSSSKYMKNVYSMIYTYGIADSFTDAYSYLKQNKNDLTVEQAKETFNSMIVQAKEYQDALSNTIDSN